jgi:hypothetical protein
MSLWGKQISQHVPEIAVGIAAGLITQMLVMATISLARPLAKAAIKGGFIIRDAAWGVSAVTEFQVGKLTGKTEVKARRRLPKAQTGDAMPQVKEPL